MMSKGNNPEEKEYGKKTPGEEKSQERMPGNKTPGKKTPQNKESLAGRREWILLAAVFLLAAGLFAFNRLRHSAPAANVEVTLDGEVVETFDLGEDLDFVIESHEGGDTGTNRLIIKDGEAWISEASCPDKICVQQGRISRDGEMIVCLPHLMIVRVVGGE